MRGNSVPLPSKLKLKFWSCSFQTGGLLAMTIYCRRRFPSLILSHIEIILAEGVGSNLLPLFASIHGIMTVNLRGDLCVDIISVSSTGFCQFVHP
jgi:hypothetical protein